MDKYEIIDAIVDSLKPIVLTPEQVESIYPFPENPVAATEIATIDGIRYRALIPYNIIKFCEAAKND